MKVMSGLCPMHRYNFACIIHSRILRLSMAFVITAFLAACGDKDPILSSTDTSPVLEDFAIAYIKRPVDALGNPRDVTTFPPELDVNDGEGLLPGDVYLRDLSSLSAEEQPLTTSITAVVEGDKSAGDVSGLEVSYDGTKLLFAMHAGMYEERDEEEQPKWNIWEYDLAADKDVNPLQRVITSDITAEEGNDVDPHYLPDGRIVFTSDRQLRSKRIASEINDPFISLDEDRRNPAFVLHVIDRNNNEKITQISFNQSNDINPGVLSNGKIIFSRWDHVGPRNEFSIYNVNPDGTALDVFYGAHSHATNTSAQAFVDIREMQDGRLLSTLMPSTGTSGGGEMVVVDKDNFTEINEKRFGSPSLNVEGQYSATDGDVNRGRGVSQFGRYTTPYPIWEPNGGDRVLVSWTVCRLTDKTPRDPVRLLPCTDEHLAEVNTNADDPSGLEPATPFYGIYMYDLSSNLKRLIALPDKDRVISNPVAIIARDFNAIPPIIPDKSVAAGDLDDDLKNREVGVIHIKSVYDTQGNVAMTDRPLEPLNRPALTDGERDNIPMATVMLDAQTGAISPTGTVARRVADLTILSDPAQTSGAQRPARFIRVTKAVPTPARTPTEGEIPDNQFGNTANYEMREILGYTEVEPDGSVYMEVPAEVPIAIAVTDAWGRSLMSHTNWIQVMPGEVRVCNGCHSPRDGQQSINQGAPVDGLPFPNTNNNIAPLLGETMAETLARLSCLSDCTYQRLSSDIIYSDVWASPEVQQPTTIGYSGAEGLGTTSPIAGGNATACETQWEWVGTSKCRIVINYEEHIQPIWEATRLRGLGDGPVDYRCTSCHNTRDITDAIDQVPGGHLDLKRDTLNGANRLPSYDTLFNGRRILELDLNGNLRVKIERDADDNPLDANGQIIDENDVDNFVFPDQRPTLVVGGVARARFSRLVQIITGDQMRLGDLQVADNTIDHANEHPLTNETLLTDGEKRLIIEWIDNGGHYFNDPVKAPKN